MNDAQVAKAKERPEKKLGKHHELGARIARARELLGLTQREMAGRFGDYQDLQPSRWERGINRAPDVVLKGLAEAAKVDLGWLMTGQGTPQPVVPRGPASQLYPTLQSYLAEHGRAARITEEERDWLASQRFSRERGDIGDEEWWASQLMRYRGLILRTPDPSPSVPAKLSTKPKPDRKQR